MTRYLISFDDGWMSFPAEDLPAVGEAAHKVVFEAMNAGVWVFGGGLESQRPAIEDHGGRISITPGRFPQQRPQVMDHGREAPGGDPALRLLMDRRPRREVARQVAPRGTGPHNPAQRVIHLAQIVAPLGRVGGHQREIRGDERPLLIRHVTRVGSAGFLAHVLSLRPLPSS